MGFEPKLASFWSNHTAATTNFNCYLITALVNKFKIALSNWHLSEVVCGGDGITYHLQLTALPEYHEFQIAVHQTPTEYIREKMSKREWDIPLVEGESQGKVQGSFGHNAVLSRYLQYTIAFMQQWYNKFVSLAKYILLQIQKQTLARLNEPLSELKRHCTWNVKYRPLFELKLYKYNSHEMKGLYGN